MLKRPTARVAAAVNNFTFRPAAIYEQVSVKWLAGRIEISSNIYPASSRRARRSQTP